MKKLWLLLVMAVPLESIHAQRVHHAPTAEQCRADQRLCDSMLEQPKSVNNVSFDELGDWAEEMVNCMGVVDPENEFEYFKAISGITGWKLLRVQSFLQRHHMYDQFIAEDKQERKLDARTHR
jgi:hypothetical protein